MNKSTLFIFLHLFVLSFCWNMLTGNPQNTFRSTYNGPSNFTQSKQAVVKNRVSLIPLISDQGMIYVVVKKKKKKFKIKIKKN